MAEQTQEKKSWLKKVDEKADAKGGGIKALWQIVKFLIVSCGVFIIQLLLAYLLPLIFDHVTATLPAFLQAIFKPNVIFDVSTVKGAEQAAKYVVGGVITWGYILTFFLSNALANVYGYIQNKKTTFKSDAPKYCFVIYIILLVALILFSTWLQGEVFGALTRVDNSFVSGIARAVAAMAAGLVQMLILFPMEKFVLLKEKDDKKAADEKKPADAKKD